MPRLTEAIECLLDVADDFGEEQVIRDVAKRAGLIWTCRECGDDNVVGDFSDCASCGARRREGLRPLIEWDCVCGARTLRMQCPACRRTAGSAVFSQVTPCT